MSTPALPAVEEAAAISRPAWRVVGGVARLALKAGVLAFVVGLTALALLWFVPEANNYAQATRIKHERLAGLTGRKIVLVGGSNLAFGIDSAMIERETGCSVVNMGMNGNLGVGYLLDESAPYLNQGDMVVVAFEYDSLYKPLDGAGADHLMIVKAWPENALHLNLRQLARMAKAIPFVAQQKVLRLLGALGFRTDAAAAAPEGDLDRIRERVETISGLSPQGDLVSHLSIDWPAELEQGVDLTGGVREDGVFERLRAFTENARARGAEVIISYTPVERSFYERHKASIDDYHARVSATEGLVAPSPPSSFVFDERYFFDTVYHLGAEGRETRTRMVLGDLARQYGPRAFCSAGAATGD